MSAAWTRAHAREAQETLCGLEQKAHDEVFGLGHATELMELFGDWVGAPGAC
jgi:hypothetical protein